ncbi:MAG: GTP-binding protein [Lachnospiraceae bacterium]|nr:GTP-binding protein [Candidatus Merdinaster equi]
MTKIDVFSGFLGAGKTTLIKKLLKESLSGEKVVLIENEFGEIGVDGGFLKEAGIEIKEMNSGCICCSLVGDFGESLKEVLTKYTPERVLIEPSGVGKLSDVIRAVQNVDMGDDVVLNSAVAVVDASKAKMYIKNFGEFFINQIEHAGTIVLSRTGKMDMAKIQEAVALIREHNEKATIITTDWDQITGDDIISAMDGSSDLKNELLAEIMEKHSHHHDDEECDDPECSCHHHHHHDDDDDHECCHHDHDHKHHHHHDGEECDDPECSCHHDHDHEHHHHHHHHADEVFTSWGLETPAKYSAADIEKILSELGNDEKYGLVLRAKGMVPSSDGEGWVYFDYVPEESNVREGRPDVTGKFCVIGSKLKEDALKELFAK